SSSPSGAANRASGLVGRRLWLLARRRVRLCVIARRVAATGLQVALTPLPGLIRVRAGPRDGGRRLRVTTGCQRAGERLEAGIGGGFGCIHEPPKLGDVIVIEGGARERMVELCDGRVVLIHLPDSVLDPAGGDQLP